MQELNTAPSKDIISPSLIMNASPMKTTPDGLTIVPTYKAVISSLLMTVLFVLGLTIIQVLFQRATLDGDAFVRGLEYCAMGAGYCLLALPVWGIFDTLRRTQLYVVGPKYIIAFGYICLMSALLYFAYKLVRLVLSLLL